MSLWIEVEDLGLNLSDGSFIVKPKYEVEGVPPQRMIVDERSIAREHPTSECNCRHTGGDCSEYIPTTSEILGLGYDE